jgi:RNA polymerase sigma factor (sigma-70 family)
MTQAEIFDAIQHSSRQESKAIEILFKTLYPKVKSIVLKNSLTQDDAQDIMQDAVLDLVYKIKTGAFQIIFENSFQRYILKFATNKSYSLRRQKLKFVNNLFDNMEVEQEEPLSIRKEELLNKVFDVANSTSIRGAEVLHRRFIKEQSYSEIAEAMNYTCVASSKNQMHRTVLSLRKSINFENYIEK